MFVCQILNTGQLQHSGTTQPENLRIQPRCTSSRLNFAKHFQNIIKIGTKQKKGSLPFTVSGLEWLLTEESLTCGLSRHGLNSSRRNQQTEHFTSSSSSRSNLRPPCQEILNCYKSEMMFRNTFTKQFPSRLLLESLSDPLVGQRDQPPKIKEPTVTCLPDWLELLQREFPTTWHDKLAWLTGWEDKWTNHDSPQQKEIQKIKNRLILTNWDPWMGPFLTSVFDPSRPILPEMKNNFVDWPTTLRKNPPGTN